MAKEIQGEKLEEVLTREKPDRRLLPHVPSRQRSGRSRRALPDKVLEKYDYLHFTNGEEANARYLVDYPVKITAGGRIHQGRARDISVTGMGLAADPATAQALVRAGRMELEFEIIPGTMPEGLERKVKVEARCVRPSLEELENQLRDKPENILLGLAFDQDLLDYSQEKSRFDVPFVSSLLAIICLCILLMRTESVVYFKFNKYLYLYSIIASTFLLVKYIFGAFYRPVPVDPRYTPGVSILVPCFNEEKWIRRTILCALDQYYPPEQLEVIVVDDHSTDRSVENIRETLEEIRTKEGPETADRVKLLVQPVNRGKREALARGAKAARHELVVFVDSDSFLDPYAIRNLVQPFKDAHCGGVSGRTWPTPSPILSPKCSRYGTTSPSG